MKRTVLLLASMSLVVLFAGGAALAVTPTGPAQGSTDATAAARGPDAALDRALKELVGMPGAPPGSSPWCSAGRVGRSTPSGWRT